jgi:DNA-binding MarR family transcriptional regulator
MRSNQPSPPLELEEFLCFAVYSAGHAFNRVYQPLLKDLGLTYPQFIALIALWDEDGLTVGELGEKLFLQSNTLTPMLKRLESLGYIKRSRDSADERQVRVHVTAAGRRLQSRASDIVRRVRQATGLSNKQFEQLLEDVGSLRGALEESVSPPA